MGKPEVSGELRSDSASSSRLGLARSTGRWQAEPRSGPTLRRTSALVTEWSQNWGHPAKLSY